MDEALAFLRDYPYMAGSLLSLAILVVPLLLILPRHQRVGVIKVGVLNAFLCPFCALLEGTYWSPARLGGWRLGMEDVLISFTLAAAAWGLAIWPYRRSIETTERIGVVLRSLPGPLVYLVPFVGFHLAGLSWMTSYLAALLLIVVVELLLRPGLWPLAVVGAAAFSPVYFLFVLVVFAVSPGFSSQWNPAPPWGLPVLGVPLGEIVWAFLFGAALPLIAGRVLGVRKVPAATPAGRDPIPLGPTPRAGRPSRFPL